MFLAHLWWGYSESHMHVFTMEYHCHFETIVHLTYKIRLVCLSTVPTISWNLEVRKVEQRPDQVKYVIDQ